MQPWLYIVILGAGIVGYAYLRPRDVEPKRTAVVNDIEVALDQFAEELEEGNKELMISVSGLKRELEADINKLSGRLSALEGQNKLMYHTFEARIEHSSDKEVVKSPINKNDDILEGSTMEVTNTVEKPHENDIKKRYEAIFELHAQGKSVEFIAKKTGMNKGEIQLIFQLARQEEQFRA